MNQSSVLSKMKNSPHQRHTELPPAVTSLDVRASAGEVFCLEFLD
jgi:hypothetical protein